jgi:hypothetical protein
MRNRLQQASGLSVRSWRSGALVTMPQEENKRPPPWEGAGGVAQGPDGGIIGGELPSGPASNSYVPGSSGTLLPWQSVQLFCEVI